MLFALPAIAIGVAVVLGRDGGRGSDADRIAGPVALRPISAQLRRGNPPAGLDGVVVPASYRELAAFRSERGKVVYVFVGRAKRGGNRCVGLRSSAAVGLSCGAALENGSPTHVLRTGFGGESFVSGIAASSVAMIEFSDGQGGVSRRVGVTDGAFVVQGSSAAVVGALNAAGDYVDR